MGSSSIRQAGVNGVARQPRRWVGLALAGLLVAGVLVVGAGPATAAVCDTPPSGQWLGTWAVDNSPGGGSTKSDLVFSDSGVTGTLVFSTGQSVLAPGSAIVGTRAPGSCHFNASAGGGVVTGEGTISPSGVEITGTWAYLSLHGTWRVGLVSDSVSGAGTSLTTDESAQGVSLADPISTNVESPIAGPITIDEAISTGGSLAGYSILDTVVRVTAPAGTPDAPLALTFSVDSSALGGVPASSLTVFRNGVLVPLCLGAVPPITIDPCVSAREALAPPLDGVRFTVLTSQASVWVFGAPAGSLGLRILTTSLPAATLGQPYSAALVERGSNLALKWKKIGRLPKGLKLNPTTGVISGIPKKTTGIISFGVQVREVVKKSLRQIAAKTLSITVS